MHSCSVMLEMQRSTEKFARSYCNSLWAHFVPYMLPALLIYNVEILTKLSPTKFVGNLSTSIILETRLLDVGQ